MSTTVSVPSSNALSQEWSICAPDRLSSAHPGGLQRAIRVAHELFFQPIISRPIGTFLSRCFNAQRRSALRRHAIDQSSLSGEFFHHDDHGTWLIVAKRHVIPGLCTLEYEAIRFAKNNYEIVDAVRAVEGEEVAGEARRRFVVKICASDDPDDHVVFMQQYKALRRLNDSYTYDSQRKHFPNVVGAGAFRELPYLTGDSLLKRDEEPAISILSAHPYPRPYFIQEQIPLSLPAFLNAFEDGVVDANVARDLCVGMLQALRLLHRLGIVHRGVAAHCFALRLGRYREIPAAGMDLMRSVCLVDMSTCHDFRPSLEDGEKPGRIVPFVGSFMYSSPNAMNFLPQFPADDACSVLYIFVEMLSYLPWKDATSRKEIVALKEAFHEKPHEITDTTVSPQRQMNFEPLRDAFALLSKVQPYFGEVPYIEIYSVLTQFAAKNTPQKQNPLLVTSDEREDIWITAINRSMENKPETEKTTVAKSVTRTKKAK